MMRRIACALLLSAHLALACEGCGGPPQIGPDRDSFKAVDALYTAVSLRDSQLLTRCAQTIQDLRANGKLPEAAGQSLESMIAEAREGKWEDAQGRLGDFMRRQRR
jgi:hypothetical protein